jgi:hypothetical protein
MASQVTDVVVGLWSDVIKTVNRILDADKRFGFTKIESNLHPSLEDILHSLAIIEGILKAFLDSDLLDHDENRQALNASQCVLHIRSLARALKESDKDEYAKAIELLDKQAKF